MSLDKKMNAEPAKPNQYLRQATCGHGVVFNVEKARSMSSDEVKKAYPRLDGLCPKGCGFSGIAYESFLHYLSGDW